MSDFTTLTTLPGYASLLHVVTALFVSNRNSTLPAKTLNKLVTESVDQFTSQASLAIPPSDSQKAMFKDYVVFQALKALDNTSGVPPPPSLPTPGTYPGAFPNPMYPNTWTTPLPTYASPGYPAFYPQMNPPPPAFPFPQLLQPAPVPRPNNPLPNSTNATPRHNPQDSPMSHAQSCLPNTIDAPSVGNSAACSDITGIEDLRSIATQAPPRATSIRYRSVSTWDTSCGGAVFDASFLGVIQLFNAKWVCHLYSPTIPSNDPTPSLVCLSRRSPQACRSARNQAGDLFLDCICSCQKSPARYPIPGLTNPDQKDIVRIEYSRRPGTFHFRARSHLYQSTVSHFKLRDEDPHAVPPALITFMEDFLKEDPYGSPAEIFTALLYQPLSAIGDVAYNWIRNHLVNGEQSFGTSHSVLMNKIQECVHISLRRAASQSSSQNDRTTTSHVSTNTAYGLMNYSSNNSIFRYPTLHAMSRPQMPNLVPFPSFQHFMEFYGFTSDSEVLTIPIEARIFDSIPAGTFRDQAISSALSAIVYVTPAMLWAVHQVIYSPTHSHLLVWYVDGYFKFART